ncbi:hypothetical protein BCR34DRAFT_667898 [Clohesyomyces aquaticus]|uniref:Uncharacterized protein n=1 Tax=Clohesyomyces aquaticus TaxID=1231657 RepID=A0A1Y1YUJ4_9PLEO|nr:hypothetical protein BCR34DRAFT_667898 [Clohesyomyces aquaticus]
MRRNRIQSTSSDMPLHRAKHSYSQSSSSWRESMIPQGRPDAVEKWRNFLNSIKGSAKYLSQDNRTQKLLDEVNSSKQTIVLLFQMVQLFQISISRASQENQHMREERYSEGASSGSDEASASFSSGGVPVDSDSSGNSDHSHSNDNFDNGQSGEFCRMESMYPGEEDPMCLSYLELHPLIDALAQAVSCEEEVGEGPKSELIQCSLSYSIKSPIRRKLETLQEKDPFVHGWSFYCDELDRWPLYCVERDSDALSPPGDISKISVKRNALGYFCSVCSSTTWLIRIAERNVDQSKPILGESLSWGFNKNCLVCNPCRLNFYGQLVLTLDLSIT